MDDDWFDYLIERYKSVKEEVGVFEYAMNRLSGKQSQVLKDMVLGR